MARILIAYYTRSGNTKSLAYSLQKALAGNKEDIELREIVPLKKMGIVSGILKGFSKKSIEIAGGSFDASRFDLVIVMGQIWAGSVTPPVYSFINVLKTAKRIAIILTANDISTSTKAFETLNGIINEAEAESVFNKCVSAKTLKDDEKLALESLNIASDIMNIMAKNE